ncbi:SemiSWEET family transporter [Spiroplasma cantharicola]|uniref:MtN3 and saliva related transmembrane protein n=1 Tax=Spiroplasma cantharicola TaxID=362837 RepID=A0A0M4K1M3_9MOLU|nr:SemiSWEET family transporter [Spiroplasma cantharicola]ALD66525.1 hypothetical protein SCANT_v1c06190 [Spiroplasma cantharicola]
MQIYEIMGWIGTILTAVYLIPQVIKVIKTKNTKDISYYSIIILIIASLIWIIYGLLTPIPQPQVYITNIFQAIFSTIILVVKIICLKESKKE